MQINVTQYKVVEMAMEEAIASLGRLLVVKLQALEEAKD